MTFRKTILPAALLTLSLALPAVASADAPAFTISAALSRGATPTAFAVYDTGEITPSDDGERLYRIEYTLPDGSTSPQALIFPCLSEEGIVPMLRFVDLNFDGFMDVEALRVSGATNTYSTYFINDGSSAAFTEAPALRELSSYTLYPGQRLIHNHEHDSWATGIDTMFSCPPGESQPKAFRVASFLYDERDLSVKTLRLLLTACDAEGVATVAADEVYLMDMSEEAYQAVWDRIDAFLWAGIDATEPPLAMYLYVNPNGGVRYHRDARCASMSPQYWDSLISLQRWELNAAPYDALTPCEVCRPD